VKFGWGVPRGPICMSPTCGFCCAGIMAFFIGWGLVGVWGLGATRGPRALKNPKIGVGGGFGVGGRGGGAGSFWSPFLLKKGGEGWAPPLGKGGGWGFQPQGGRELTFLFVLMWCGVFGLQPPQAKGEKKWGQVSVETSFVLSSGFLFSLLFFFFLFLYPSVFVWFFVGFFGLVGKGDPFHSLI